MTEIILRFHAENKILHFLIYFHEVNRVFPCLVLNSIDSVDSTESQEN